MDFVKDRRRAKRRIHKQKAKVKKQYVKLREADVESWDEYKKLYGERPDMQELFEVVEKRNPKLKRRRARDVQTRRDEDSGDLPVLESRGKEE